MFGKPSKNDKQETQAAEDVAGEVNVAQPSAEELEISSIADATPEASEAKALVLTGQITQAEYLLETILEKNPSNCDVWHALGHARRLQNKLEEAKEAYSHAIEVAYRYHSIIHFEHSAACLQRALLLFFMGEEDKAIADIQQAIFQDHNNQAALKIQKEGWSRGMELPDYDSNLMTALACEQEIRRAPYTFDQLLPYQQTHDKAIFYWRHDQTEHAIGMMSDMLKQHPDYAMAWHHRALMFLELGDTRQAHADLDKAVLAGEKWHRNYHYSAALHHLHRGQIQHQMGDSDMAMMDYTKAVDIDKNLPEGHVSLAVIHHERGQLPTAMADLDKALALEPKPEWQQLKERWQAAMG